jgi:hypothetical protein
MCLSLAAAAKLAVAETFTPTGGLPANDQGSILLKNSFGS